MKRLLILALTLGLLFPSCTDRDDDLKAVNIRIKNVSNLVYEEVTVGDTEEVHTNVAPDAFSEYFEYEEAYMTAFIQIRSGEDTFSLQPIDFVGEEPLPLGFYTYELGLSESGDVILTFVID